LNPEFIRELFTPFRPVTVRRMFGCAGIFCEGLMFARVFDGAIYLKVDEACLPDFEREGSRTFVYTRAKSPSRVGRAAADPRAWHDADGSASDVFRSPSFADLNGGSLRFCQIPPPYARRRAAFLEPNICPSPSADDPAGAPTLTRAR
jgi:TfoX/Sxy family transcriptional regulator of competence genes